MSIHIKVAQRLLGENNPVNMKVEGCCILFFLAYLQRSLKMSFHER